MDKKRCLIVGSGGREASIAYKLKDQCIVFAIMNHKNPTICSVVEMSGGIYEIGNTLDGEFVSNFAKKNCIDISVVNNDEILAAGVVDYLLEKSIPTFGPTKEGIKDRVE